MRRLHARINAHTLSTSHNMVTVAVDDFAMTTYTDYQFDGSTDSIRLHPADEGILPTDIIDTLRTRG